MSIDTSYCTTCGAYDTYACNGDNQVCTECGDTEGLVFEGDEKFPDEEDEEDSSCPMGIPYEECVVCNPFLTLK